MEESEFNYINVIPLVDIMLVLLTIVLTTSTLIASGAIPVQLPQASPQRQDLLAMQTIEIDKQGLVFFNSLPVCGNGLRDALVNVNRTAPVLIRADRTLVLQVFVNVLDVIKQLGFTRVSLQTESAR